MLTDLQVEIAQAVLEVARANGFALAGGGALILHGVIDRGTRDLDFFTTEADAIADTAARVQDRLAATGFEVVRRIDAESFVRMEVRRDDEACDVDLGHDARRWPAPDREPVGPTVSLEELAADKTLALLGRSAPRDFRDVRALEKIFGRERLCELAADKDLGFSRRHLADAIGEIARLDRAAFGVSDPEYQDLLSWADDWRTILLEQSRDLERDRGVRRDRGRSGPEIGF